MRARDPPRARVRGRSRSRRRGRARSATARRTRRRAGPCRERPRSAPAPVRSGRRGAAPAAGRDGTTGTDCRRRPRRTRKEPRSRPGQNGHRSGPALSAGESSGRVFRAGAIPTHASVNTSRRLWICGAVAGRARPLLVEGAAQLPVDEQPSPVGMDEHVPGQWSHCFGIERSIVVSDDNRKTRQAADEHKKAREDGIPGLRDRLRSLGIGADWGAVDDRESLAALHAAVDAGVTFIDTADVYGDGRSERLVGRLLRERPEPLVVATKFGRRVPLDLSPLHVRQLPQLDRAVAREPRRRDRRSRAAPLPPLGDVLHAVGVRRLRPSGRRGPRARVRGQRREGARRR